MSWLEAQKTALVSAALEQAGLPSKDMVIPEGSRMLVREVLIVLLEKERVCARDSVRIASAWVSGREPPTDWRYA